MSDSLNFPCIEIEGRLNKIFTISSNSGISEVTFRGFNLINVFDLLNNYGERISTVACII